MSIAAHVFATWTHRGARPAQLADRFLDGSIDQLECFLAASSNQPQMAVEPAIQLTTAPSAAALAQQAGQCVGCLDKSDGRTMSSSAQAGATAAQHADRDCGCRQHLASSSDSRPQEALQRIDVRDAAGLSYDEFVRRYMAANEPVVIRVSTAAACRPCRSAG